MSTSTMRNDISFSTRNYELIIDTCIYKYQLFYYQEQQHTGHVLLYGSSHHLIPNYPCFLITLHSCCAAY